MYGMIEIREATKSQATEIACLIMTAMTDDCCLYSENGEHQFSSF